MQPKLHLSFAVIAVLAVCSPSEAWYKQVAGPSYYSVGRASGLLSGIRRSPHVRREESPSDSGETEINSVLSDLISHNSILKTMVCIIFFSITQLRTFSWRQPFFPLGENKQIVKLLAGFQKQRSCHFSTMCTLSILRLHN